MPAKNENVPRPKGGAAKKYKRPRAEYARQFGKSLRTIKRYAAAGYPLDDPDAMGDFLSPRGRKPAVDAGADDSQEARPRRFSALDDALDAMGRRQPADGAGDEFDDPPPIALDETFFAGQGVLAAIERLQKAERERAAAYFTAVKSRSSTQALQNRFKEWMGIIDALRKLEASAPEIRKANRLSIDRAEAQADAAATFNDFRKALDNLPSRAAAKLEGITDRDEIEEILEREKETVLRRLVDLAFDAIEESDDDLQRPPIEADEPEPAAPEEEPAHA